MRFRVLYDGLFTFGLRLLNVGCAAGLGILTARLLGPAGKGEYVLPSVEAGLVSAAFGGLGSALSYFLLNRRTGPQILKPLAVTSLFFVAAGAAAIVPIAFFSGERWAAIPAIASLPAAAAVNVAGGYALGVKRVRYSTGISVAVTVLTFACMMLGLFFISRSPAVAIAMWLLAGWSIAAMCAIGVALHARGLQGTERIGTREFLRFSIKVGLVNLVSLLNYRADLYIVAAMTSVAILGMYSVAVSAAESLLIPTQVAALVTSPHVGSLDVRAAAELAARCVRNNLVIALAVCVPLIFLAAPIVRLLYGAAFAPAVPALRLLLVGVVALSLASPLSSYFTLKLGKPEVPLWLAGGSAAICIGLSFALIPSAGMLGAAAASTAAYIAAQIAATWYFSVTAQIRVRTILVPTAADVRVYRAFAARLLIDGRNMLRTATSR